MPLHGALPPHLNALMRGCTAHPPQPATSFQHTHRTRRHMQAQAREKQLRGRLVIACVWTFVLYPPPYIALSHYKGLARGHSTDPDTQEATMHGERGFFLPFSRGFSLVVDVLSGYKHSTLTLTPTPLSHYTQGLQQRRHAQAYARRGSTCGVDKLGLPFPVDLFLWGATCRQSLAAAAPAAGGSLSLLPLPLLLLRLHGSGKNKRGGRKPREPRRRRSWST